jgi:hypothetical protein
MKMNLFTSFIISLFLVASSFSTVLADEYPFELNVLFYVNDKEENPSDLIVDGISSDTNILSSISITPYGTNQGGKKLTIQSSSNFFGNASVSLKLSDNGYIQSQTKSVSITPRNVSSTNYNSPLFPTFKLIGSTRKVTLSWFPFPAKSDYLITKFDSTNSLFLNTPTFLKRTSLTNFVDTNVVNAKKYWYNISWIPIDYVPLVGDILTTNVVFNIRIRPRIVLTPIPPNGLFFLNDTNKVYQIFYQSYPNLFNWTLLTEISDPLSKIIILNDKIIGFDMNNFIYVREKE